MIVTINTDASFTKKHQRGTYAFWIVCNRFKIQKAGILRKKCSCPSIAEIRSIINAIHVLGKEDCRGVSRIIINTDCMNAIHVLTDDKQAIRRYRLTYSGIRKRYVEVLHNSFLVHVKIEFRHVKSHTVICDARSYVNEWCDTEAKKKIDFLIKQIEA